MIYRFLITATLLLLSNFIQAQESGKSKSSTKNYERAGNKRQGVTLWNCNEINTPRNDFAPMFYQYGIVFASSEKNGPIDAKTNEPFFQLYYAETDRNNIPLASRAYSLQANSPYHEGGVTFSRKGDLMYFSSNNQQNGFSQADAKGVTRMKIYEAKRGARDWENVTELDFNQDKYTCFHPTLSADGRYLYFSSDMPGGQGGFDLYVSEKKGKSWSKPMNLGAKVNTTADDAFPFIHESGVLFFASKGGSGLGGFDLFKIDLNKTGAATQNLGEPFNTNADDLGLILNSDGEVGYFGSNREGGFGKDDIYMFKCDKRLTTETFLLNGLITTKDESTGEKIEGSAIRIFEKGAEGFLVGSEYYDVQFANDQMLKIENVRKAAEQLGAPDRFTTSNGEAKYDFKNDREYLIIASKEGYESKEIIFNTFEKVAGLTFVDMMLNRMKKSLLRTMVRNEKLNRGVPNALVKIVNKKTGIVQNFRTNNQGEMDFTPEQNTTYEISIEKEGYRSLVESVEVDGQIGRIIEKNFSLTAIEPEVETKPISAGTVIVLEKIYYDFNRAIIRQGAAQELDALSNLMQQYPSMEVELVSHTDARGNNDYNQRLAEQRAISAKNYLIARGISAARIAARGAGESQLRNNCADGVNCTEEEHQYNRRTEVKIVRINESDIKVQYGDKGPETVGGKN